MELTIINHGRQLYDMESITSSGDMPKGSLKFGDSNEKVYPFSNFDMPKVLENLLRGLNMCQFCTSFHLDF